MINKLLSKFKWKTVPVSKDTITVSEPIDQTDIDSWLFPRSASSLLNTELRQKYLSVIWQQVSMTKEMFDTLYRRPIEHYAEMVQLLPASESHHHSHLGGMLDHTLEVVSFAAKLRQSYVLPQSAAPEEQSKQRDVWTAAVIYAALVHDIGKIIVDIEIHLKDGSRWFAWNGIPTQPYKFKYIKNRDYELHPVLGSFLADKLIPQKAFDWLAQFPQAFSAFIYTASNHKDRAGVLSEIIQKADQHSVTLALGGDVTKLVSRPVNSLAKQLVMALRHLLRHKLKINNPKGPGDGWFTEEGLWLMSKTSTDLIRTYLLEQGISVPSDNRKLFDELQSLNIIVSTQENTAIWYCKVKAQSGWKSKDTFSVLRINPEVAWESIDERPEFFAGEVEIVTKKSEIGTESDAHLEVPESNIKHREQVVSEESDDKELPFIDDAVILRSPTREVESTQTTTDYVLELLTDPQYVEDASFSKETSENTALVERNATNNEEQTRLQSKKAKKRVKNNSLRQVVTDKQPTATHAEAGKQFVEWLQQNIQDNKLQINKPTAKIHIVDNYLFLVTPSLFQYYLQRKGEDYGQDAVSALQYDFQSLGLHQKRVLPDQSDSVNFWQCAVIGPRKTSKLTGYLVRDVGLFFGNKPVLNNQRLTLLEE